METERITEKAQREDGLEIHTRRLRIRFVRESDWKALMEILADFNRSGYARYDVPHRETAGEAQEKARRWAALSPEREHMFFAVCLADAVIGYVIFHKTPEGYEIGYCFHSAYHGKGYARESLEALLWAISQGRETEFAAGTALANLPSVHLLTALGFVQTGTEQVSFYQDEQGAPLYFDGGIFRRKLGAVSLQD